MWKLLLPVLMLLGVVAAATLSDRPQPRADFTFINRGNVSTLDITTMSWMQDLRIARILFEGLVKNDVFTWEYATRPGVAERWETSPDGMTWTFHLRENARWSNGDPVLASDFVYSWRRAMTPDAGADYVKFFDKFKGFREYYQWRTQALAAFAADRSHPTRQARADAARALWQQTLDKFSELVAVRTPDQRTIIVTLIQPVPYFLDLVAFPTLYPLHEKTLRLYERLNTDTGRMEWEHGWTKPPRLISNGPFKLTIWRFMRDMRLEQNPHYWDRQRLAIRTISIPSIEDPNAAVLAFQTGGVDWVSDVTAPYRGDIIAQKEAFYREHWDKVQSLRAQGLDPVEIDRRLPPDPRNRIHVFPAFGTYWYNFNCLPRLPDGRPNPFADPRVRRAFAKAVDKQAIVDNVRRIGEPVARTLIPPGSIPGYESPRGLDFDPAAARALLAEAGFPTGRDFPVAVEIMFNKDAGHDLIAQAVAKNWEQHLGVSVILQQKEIKVFREDLKNANFMTSRAGWFGDYGDPTTFLYLNRTGDGNNDRRYSNPRYDQLLDQAASELDPRRRMALLAEAERIIVEEDVPMFPIFHYSQVYLFDPHRITGISSHPRQEQAMYEVDVLGDGLGTDAIKVLPPRVRSGRTAQ